MPVDDVSSGDEDDSRDAEAHAGDPRAQGSPIAGLSEQLRRMQMTPVLGLSEQLRNMQVAPLAGMVEQLRQMQVAPLAGLSEQLHQMQMTPVLGLSEQLRNMQVAPLAGIVDQVREMSQRSMAFRTSSVQALIRNFEAAPDIATFVAEFDAGSLLASADVAIPRDVSQTDFADWFRSVAAGLLLYGGPILVLQVLLITWTILGDIGPAARTRFAEFATFVGLAVATAPAFAGAARKLTPPPEDADG